MAPRSENARKRKQTAENLKAAVSSSSDDDDQRVTQRNRKACRVRTNAAVAPDADEESIEHIGALIQDLFHSDNDKFGNAIVALYLNLYNDEKKCESFVTAGGCLALVQVLKNCLDKAIDEIPACDQVTELNELAELTTLLHTLCVIVSLTFQHDGSPLGIAAIGGVESVVKIMKTFPKCESLHERACGTLYSLISCSTGKTNAIAAGGIAVLLDAIKITWALQLSAKMHVLCCPT
jgi:hypothetical protein